MDSKGEEIAAVIQEIRERVRSRFPNGGAPGAAPYSDLTELMHARDAAQAKVASIGSVNPRPGGFRNNLIQSWKRMLARVLDWHVREQVEFNRGVMRCVQASLDAFSETNRALAVLSGQVQTSTAELRSELQAMSVEARELKDIRTHWYQWRQEWERKLSENEIYFLRGVSELQSAFQHRVTLMDAAYRELGKSQHAEFNTALERAGEDIQKKLWADLERIRLQYETIIHAELRLVRKRAAIVHSEPKPETEPEPLYDSLHFAEKFRGSEEPVLEQQRFYGEHFAGCHNVLDIGCGRGEMLEVLREAGVQAKGIDLSAESVAICKAKGLDTQQADVFSYLSGLPERSLDGIVCSQVIEHLPPDRIPELIRLAHGALRNGALIALETPNPESLAIFSTHFYLDPTHQRPIPPALLAFYLEEGGFGAVKIERIHPARETLPAVDELPAGFRDAFFGALDYVAFARRLG